MARATAGKDDGSLKRLGGGRWQTRDERFTVEPQSGTWVVVDAEQIDDLGLPLVRGPFGSLTAAKGAIEAARGSEPAISPLLAQVARLRDRATVPGPSAKGSPGSIPGPVKPELPADPSWIRDLAPAERRRARDLVDRLTRSGASDPEGVARREIVGDVPAVAALAIARALAAGGPDARPAEVARLLADGQDADLGVRWRLTDGEGRPILLDLATGGHP